MRNASLLATRYPLLIALSWAIPCGATPRDVDSARAAALGIRKLESHHLVLYTDVPSAPEVDRLPEIFDRAVPQWANYFDVPRDKISDWRMQAYLIAERQKFDALHLMPIGNDGFPHGFSLGHELWLYDQPTDYYRRHLLLHEGTHGFMATLLGGCGPGWYMEGTAELLATHHWDARHVKLTLRTMPRSRREVPMLGRIKLIRDAFAEDRALSLPAVLKIDNRRRLENEAYAWCWALARLLDDHPHYRERFRTLQQHVLDPRFNDLVRQLFADDWHELTVEWQSFVATLDHGHDVERAAIEFREGKTIGNKPLTVTTASDRGWQSTGALLEAGREYQITATGRYELARDADGTWWCEPGGVTIEYVAGRPLGMLLGAIDDGGQGVSQFAHPIAIGLDKMVKPEQTGTLYLRVNDAPFALADNKGEVNVTISILDD